MGVFFSKEDIEGVLRQPPKKGKHLFPPFLEFLASREVTASPIKILEDSFVSDNKPEAHDREDDIWFCLEGNPIFRWGGVLKEKKAVHEGEWIGSEIEGGTERTLHPGDWLWVPAGEPHEHNCPSGTARLFIIKRKTQEI